MKDLFWESKNISEMSREEWEALCDGCGHCCLVKLEDAETGEVFNTNVACRLLDLESCRCQDYSNRLQRIPMCVQLSLDKLSEYHWLPDTCAYRRLSQGEKLPAWHPLVTGDPGSVQAHGISVCGFALSEEYVHPDQLPEHVIED